jgi:hypothetical protein
MNGTDKDLAAHFKIIKKYGVVFKMDINKHKMSGIFTEHPIKYMIEGDSVWNGYSQLIRQ